METKLTEFGGTILMTMIFLVLLIIILINNLKNNSGLWEKYGMIFFTLIYVIFIFILIKNHSGIVDENQIYIGIGSMFYLFTSSYLTDFSFS
jgi:hypothetical protein